MADAPASDTSALYLEINGITYKIDGESLAFMCDLVDARVHHYNDGTWEIVEILGKHKKDE